MEAGMLLVVGKECQYHLEGSVKHTYLIVTVCHCNWPGRNDNVNRHSFPSF